MGKRLRGRACVPTVKPPRTDLVLPSGAGVRASDFESWLFVPAQMDLPQPSLVSFTVTPAVVRAGRKCQLDGDPERCCSERRGDHHAYQDGFVRQRSGAGSSHDSLRSCGKDDGVASKPNPNQCGWDSFR